MKWIEAKVVFDAEDNRLAGELITNLFFEFDLTGVVEEDPALESSDDWAEDSMGRPQQNAVIGYFPKDRQAKKRCRDLEQQLSLLKQGFTLLYRVSYKELDEEDWAEAWKAFFEPQKIGRKIVVKPTWCEYAAKPGDIVVKLDPGMAFGAGTHPTTALCMRLIEDYLNPGDSFLDIGTGSGILMIAAAKLGAGVVCGIDKDSVAIDVAASNLKLNDLVSDNAILRTGNLLTGITDTYDLIVANIFTHVIIELLDDLPQALKGGGIFVCSGMFEENKKLVVAGLKNMGFEIMEIREQEKWAAIASRFHS
ncbi:MAG: 50S ribosomal protein L11 methyltransferase [Desulfobacterales bacterium]|jgi:ribosomal protein L11 methyltransferase|nr:50S ribosomal protein L11 methyltransferase [Deltaproteobacteria bacterium]